MSRELEVDRAALAARSPLAWRDLAKRSLDLILGSALILILSPILILGAAAVALSTPGPILFRQQRVGHAERPFTMLKFRTMADGSDDAVHREFVTKMLLDPSGSSDREMQKLVADERVTRVGRVLRRFSLDELPQLLNVVVGDMSLVGPRPSLDWETDLFSAHHRRRFEVKPGMTGLWQVSGRSRLTMLQALDLDVEYVERRTFWLDLGILVRTIPTVVTGRDAT